MIILIKKINRYFTFFQFLFFNLLNISFVQARNFLEFPERSPSSFSIQSAFNASQDAKLYTDPQKSNRMCQCQFGYNIHIEIAGARIGQILDLGDIGHHSFSRPASHEKNGQIYTCLGGFIDFSHMRAAVDWTASLALQIEKVLNQGGGHISIRQEAGPISLEIYKPKKPVSKKTILFLAQRIAYERLTWHEIMSWYYHWPNHVISEQQSSFSPEDAYSNLLGTYIGKQALISMDRDKNLSFESAVDKAILKAMKELEAVPTKDQTIAAFDLVDRAKVLAMGSDNQTIWYDSSIGFFDQRFLFKRNVKNVTHKVTPWQVGHSKSFGCKNPELAQDLPVPEFAEDGKQRLSTMYQFTFSPSSKLFNSKTGALNGAKHSPLPKTIDSSDFPMVIAKIKKEMKEVLGEGFDDPHRQYPNTNPQHIRRWNYKSEQYWPAY